MTKRLKYIHKQFALRDEELGCGECAETLICCDEEQNTKPEKEIVTLAWNYKKLNIVSTCILLSGKLHAFSIFINLVLYDSFILTNYFLTNWRKLANLCNLHITHFISCVYIVCYAKFVGFNVTLKVEKDLSFYILKTCHFNKARLFIATLN